MVEALSLRRDTSRRGGFTLLEVVIALAIFVIGALAIIRIFPPALGVIQNSGDRLTAINLNRSVLARYAREPGLVPDSIYDAQAQVPTYKFTWRDNLVGSVAGSPRRNNSIPFSAVSGGIDQNGFVADLENSYNFSALGHFKNIMGEKHVVPQSGIIVTQFPFSGTLTAYYQDNLDNTTVSNNGVVDLSAATLESTGANYTVTTGDVVYISYNVINNNRIGGVSEERRSVTATTAQLTATANVVEGSVRVRLRRPTTVANAQPDNGSIQISDINLVGKVVSLDYTVKDWRWIVNDVAPSTNPKPTATPPPPPGSILKSIQLPIRPLDDSTSPLPYVYTIFPSANAADTYKDSNNIGGSLVAVNSKTGEVVFDVSKSAVNPAVPTARVVYRTSDNWAQQLSVAASYYKQFISAPSEEEWRDYSLNGALGSNDGYIYFKPNEAGKTISVSYTYGPDSADPSQDVSVKNVLFTVNSDIKTKPGSVSSNFAVDGYVSGLQLTDKNGDALPALLKDKNGNMVPFHLQSIQEVRGLSIQARMAWLDGNNFTQASSTGFREVNN